MRHQEWTLFSVSVCAVLFTFGPGFGQTPEAEPNDLCTVAQFVGDLGAPLSVSGSLDSTESVSDIDFFRFSALAGEVVQVDMEGLFTGQGTLVDPYFGVFDSECNLIASFDYGGTGLNARGYFATPDDGLFTIGATFCCDTGFHGGGNGTYRLTAQTVVIADSLRGRLVDAISGNPLPGTQPPFSYLELYRIGPNGPELFAWSNPDDNGEFVFDSSTLVTPLLVGDYQITTYVYGYEIQTTAPFSLGPGEALDLGDLPIHPIRVIGSITGRLVDVIDGRPIPGNGVGFTDVMLFRCSGPDECNFLGLTFPDGAGYFSFDPLNFYQFLEPGDFRIRVLAYQYETYSGGVFSVAENEHRDLGDIPLRGLPIQFVDQRPCANLPAVGGTCSFQVKLRNGSSIRVRGEVWARVDYYNTGSPLGSTTFQIGRVGSSNPAPQKINLNSGQEQWIDFQFDVPPLGGDFSVSCVRTLAGRNPQPLFDTIGEGMQFCFFKESDGFSFVSGKEAWNKFQEAKKVARP